MIAYRNLVALVAVILLSMGLLFSGTAGAQQYRCTDPNNRVCDQGEALSEAWSHARRVLSSGYNPAQYEACVSASSKSFSGYITQTGKCNAGLWSTGHQTFYWGKSCAERSSATTPFFPPSGSVRCINGCESTYRDNGDDTTTYSTNGKTCDKKPDCNAQGKNMVWNAMLGVCQPVEPECPPGKVKTGNACTDEKPCPDGMALVAGSCKKKDEECPAGMIRSPLGNCIPGDGQCAQGEVRGADGTCKRDKDNDGQPDTDDPESFSGGDTCDSPPSCSGSPIMCGQARIQWRIDCNTRRNNNISGGHCSQSGMPTCTGEKCNAMEYTQLLMQWRSACAVEKLASKQDTPGQGGTNGDANGNGVADALEGRGGVTPIGDGAADVASAKKWGIGLSTSNLDTSNMFGGGGTCPEPPAITIMGKTVNAADFPYFCRIAAIFRALILIFGAYTAIQILMGRVF
ncbi:TPA: hypothetical protein QEL18_002707 [Stenotrophomonas maltophilia]|uniref:hypothetical protein n=1 Tax=Stenotrophomonas maltophilia TaxID=40324 RepID=UPI0004CFC580|nr:hypothetical protein [Stenotrophomonas maltophilia]HDS1567277.1 hypothetical protein [Stenotrophomonas maltophilia]